MKKFTAFFAAAATAATLSVSSFAAGFDAEASFAHPSIVFDMGDTEGDRVVVQEFPVTAEEQDGRLFLEASQPVEAPSQNSGENNDEQSFSIQKLGKMALISLAIGLVIALIICLVMKSRMKTAVPKTTANDYIRKNSFNITRSRDIFIYANVTKKKRAKEENKK